uniref:Ig-like domain-containing protein n=1 Tax=Heterorhabditis bacteriophora TaxID=37862 RepID=A0A1I7X1V5_HETBA
MLRVLAVKDYLTKEAFHECANTETSLSSCDSRISGLCQLTGILPAGLATPLLSPLFKLMLWSVLLIPSALGLAGRGPSSALTLTAFRSSIAHPLHFAGNITLWCAPDNPVVTIRKGYFLRKKDNKKLEAKLSFNKKNATLELNSPNVYDAGEYICELETEHGRVSHKINVYKAIVCTCYKCYLANQNFVVMSVVVAFKCDHWLFIL